MARFSLLYSNRVNCFLKLFVGTIKTFLSGLIEDDDVRDFWANLELGDGFCETLLYFFFGKIRFSLSDSLLELLD